MTKSLESAREMRFRTIYLESLPQLSRAVSMYERAGFRMLDGPLGCSGHSACTIWMIKEL
jgi:putative acetyltransferase